jgi:hypothetical protein
MVALPVPCTDWAVLAFEPRAMLEAQASQPTETALVIWLGIATFAGGLALAAGFAGASLGTPVWQAFWPDPAQGALYPRLALAGLAASALLTAAVFAAPLASRATILLSLLAAAAIVGTLVSQHRRIAATDPAGGRDPLGGRARASYLAVAGALLALLAAVPMLALAADARALDRMREAGAVAVRGIESENAANRARVLIRNNLFADRPQPLPAPVAVPSCIAASGGSLVADLVALAGEPVCVVPGGTPLPDVELGCYGRWVALLAGAGALLLPLAGLFGVARNLFGFGVPLEAIEYPRLAEAGARGGAGPPYDEAAAPGARDPGGRPRSLPPPARTLCAPGNRPLRKPRLGSAGEETSDRGPGRSAAPARPRPQSRTAAAQREGAAGGAPPAGGAGSGAEAAGGG